MAAQRDEYLKALHALSKVDPNAWATFVEAFKVFTAYELERSLTAPTVEIAVAFGHNRCITQIRDDCINIEKTMEKYRKQPIHGTV